MAFGGEVDHTIDRILLEDLGHGFRVADIGLHEQVVRCFLDVAQVLQVTRVRERIQVDDAVLRVLRDEAAHDVAADESGAAGDEDVLFHPSVSVGRLILWLARKDAPLPRIPRQHWPLCCTTRYHMVTVPTAPKPIGAMASL